MIGKNILVFDQAESAGGSIQHMVEMANAMPEIKFTIITFHQLSKLYEGPVGSNISAIRVFSFYNYQRKSWHIAMFRKYLTNREPILWMFQKIQAVVDKCNEISLVVQILSKIFRTKIDLVQLNSNLHPIPLKISSIRKVPTIAIMRCKDEFGWWKQKDLDNIGKFISVSIALQAHYLHSLKLPPEKITVIYPPVEALLKLDSVESQPLPSIFFGKNRSNRQLAIHVGRICPQKGQLDALKALKTLTEDGYDCNIIFAGRVDTDRVSVNYDVELRAFISKHKMGGLVTFVGYRMDVLSLVNNADFFLHTATDFEGLGGAIVEAMQLGKAVIASDIGGPSEFIQDGVNGYLYPANNIEELTKKIKLLLDNPRDKARIQRRASEKTIALFSSEKVVKEMMNEYLDII